MCFIGIYMLRSSISEKGSIFAKYFGGFLSPLFFKEVLTIKRVRL